MLLFIIIFKCKTLGRDPSFTQQYFPSFGLVLPQQPSTHRPLTDRICGPSLFSSPLLKPGGAVRSQTNKRKLWRMKQDCGKGNALNGGLNLLGYEARGEKPCLICPHCTAACECVSQMFCHLLIYYVHVAFEGLPLLQTLKITFEIRLI